MNVETMDGWRCARPIRVAALCAAAYAVAAMTAHAADLHANTAAAFDRYVRLTELRLDGEMRGPAPFLWIDSLPEPRRTEASAELQRGEVLVSRMDTRDAGRPIDIPGGMCHHWVGIVFVPGATLERTAALMQTYDRYQEIYRPAIQRSRLLARDGDRFTVSLQLFMKKIVTVVLNTEYNVRYVRVSSKRIQVRSSSTRIAEVQRPGTPAEQEAPVGHDDGFLWRFNNYCALEERDGGTYVQCESVSLSRDVPIGLGWLIGPFVTSIPRESLEFTLRTLRAALMKG
jgi:hypothetical protein